MNLVAESNVRLCVPAQVPADMAGFAGVVILQVGGADLVISAAAPAPRRRISLDRQTTMRRPRGFGGYVAQVPRAVSKAVMKRW